MTNRPSRAISLPTERDIARFWAMVDKREPGECWPWNGSRHVAGYGYFCAGGGCYIASRVSWFLANGRQPEGFACHSCDNPNCVNPSHIWIGTQADNMRDMAAKGRGLRTHCARGHEFTADNILFRPKDGARLCRQCDNMRSRKHYARAKAARQEQSA